MVEDRIGYRYARSAYGLAVERKEADKVREDMLCIAETCSQSRELKNLLSSPLVAGTQKQKVLDAIFGKLLKTDLAKQLIEIIVRKGREEYLPNVADAFLTLYDQDNKIMRGTLTSAYEMSDATVTEIKTLMEKKTGQSFELETEVDAALIGGFTLKVEDTLFDGSIAGSIRKAKREFLNN